MKKPLLLLLALLLVCVPAMAEIERPENLVLIDDEAFSGCTGLSGALVLPEVLPAANGARYQYGVDNGGK